MKAGVCWMPAFVGMTGDGGSRTRRAWPVSSFPENRCRVRGPPSTVSNPSVTLDIMPINNAKPVCSRPLKL